MKAWITVVFSLIFCSAASANSPTLLVLGDSLSAAFGIEKQQGWVALLQKRIHQQNLNFKVINASISGETTSGGISRLPELLQRYRPSIVILALGANDGLRGLPLKQMRTNLNDMTEQSKTKGAAVLLIGMRLPPNYGPVYTQSFHDSFKDIATKQNTPLIPFLLNSIAKDNNMFQQDGLHPTAKAQGKILDHIWTSLEQML